MLKLEGLEISGPGWVVRTWPLWNKSRARGHLPPELAQVYDKIGGGPASYLGVFYYAEDDDAAVARATALASSVRVWD